MGASQNADYVASSLGGTGKPTVERVNRSFAQPAPEAKEVAPQAEEAKASKEEIEKKKADAIEANSTDPSPADTNTFVSKAKEESAAEKEEDVNPEETADVNEKKEEENSFTEQEPDVESD